MVFNSLDKIFRTRSVFFPILIVSFFSCTTIRKYQKNVPFVYKNNINLKIENISADEKVLLKSRMNTQLNDSSRVRAKDVVFVLHYIDKPPAFDTIATQQSADNMQTSMGNLGYYNAKVSYHYSIDTLKNKKQMRVTTTYEVDAGKRTLIDTFAYLLSRPELQELALKTKSESPLQKNAPVTKSAIQGEVNRLVDLYRNNGYYKFTADELRMTGDTSIEALTTVSEDPFEALRLLQQAQEKRQKPTIKLGIHLNSTSDTTRFNRYYVNNIYILPDYVPGDVFTDSGYTKNSVNNYFIHYHKKLFTNQLLVQNMLMKKGDIFRQEDYYKTLNSFYKLGVWESPVIDIVEKKDSLDMVVKLIPAKKYSFEGSIEVSYSANSTGNIVSPTNTGNLLGLAGNISLLDRNAGKRAIHITHAIRAGIELNTNQRNSQGNFINSNELGYTNNILIPKFSRKYLYKQTFINTNISQVNRIDFFNQQIFNANWGKNFSKKPTEALSLTYVNFDYRRLYNRSARFDQTLIDNPFLRYSFNTALVIGSSFNYTSSIINKKDPTKSHVFKFNIEESGLIMGRVKDILTKSGKRNFLTNYLKQFIKTNIEYTHTITHPKSAVVYRAFAGVGIPFAKNDTTLPFFKQYYGGGPNSMRGWPVRGIGVGGQPLAPYANNLFNDRTGDIQLEGNAEYRYNIAPLFGNVVLLKGAFFLDAGNIWNFRNTKPNGALDSTQFKFQNLYKQLGVSAGMGFRFDFSYLLVRFDMGFRFKRPDVTAGDGWQFPSINLANIFGNKDKNRRWRYENFNFSIGIDYPF